MNGKRLLTLNVFGVKTPVILTKLEHFRGIFDPNRQEIYISESMPKREVMATIIHEVIHAIFERTGLNQAHGIAPDVQEIICENVANWFDENTKVRFIDCK